MLLSTVLSSALAVAPLAAEPATATVEAAPDAEQLIAAAEQPLTVHAAAFEAQPPDRFSPDPEWGPRAGAWDLMITGGGVSDHNFRNHSYNFNLSIGHFITDHLLISLRQGVHFTELGDDSQVDASTRGAVDWHFDFGQLQPFVGGSVGYFYGDRDDSWMIGPEVGLKFYVQPQTYLLAMAEYQIFFDRVRDIDDEARRGQFVFTLGLGFQF